MGKRRQYLGLINREPTPDKADDWIIALIEMRDDRSSGLIRGLVWGLPLSALLWGGIYSLWRTL